jgi:outer membrane protein W
MKRFLYCFSLAFFLVSVISYGQARKPTTRKSGSFSNAQKNGNTFLNKQFWLGFKAGTNLTEANVQKDYAVLLPPSSAPKAGKEYKNFNLFGTQASLEFTFYTRGFSISLQPTYFHSRFEYSTNYEWNDTNNPTNRLLLDYSQEHAIDRADIPLLVKYDITGNKLRPFIQAGLFYSMLLNATKSVTISGTDYASGGINEFTDEPILVGAEDLFAKNYWGIMAGAGINYNLGNVRLTFEGNYRIGMSLANSTSNRYKNDRLAGIGDAMDDIRLDNITFSFGCLFPMRYLASGFKTLDR